MDVSRGSVIPTTLLNISFAAFEIIVNGKPALERIMERQSITYDANLCAIGTM